MITESDVFTCLGLFLQDILPAGVDVVQGQDNRVPAPAAPDYVVMWSSSRARLSTNHVVYDRDAETKTSTAPTKVTMQVDVHGPKCADNTQIFTTLFRDSYAADFFRNLGKGVAPLSCDDGQQLPFLNGQKQFENRWTLYAQFQINPDVSTNQTFADSITPQLIEADAEG